MIAAILVITGILCYTGQGFLKKLYVIAFQGPKEICAPLFSVLYGVLVGFGTWAYNGFRFQADTYTIVIGIVNGFALYMYNLTAIKACQTGPYTFQNLICSFSGILGPLVLSVFVWGEGLSVVQGIGLVFLFASLILYNDNGEEATKLTSVFVFWVLMNALANSAYSIAIPMQQRHDVNNVMRNEMIIITFAVSAVFSAAQFLLTKKKQTKFTLAIGTRAWIYCILTCVCAGIAINTIMIAIQYLHPGIVYATENGGIMICQVVLCVLLLKEKQTRRQWAGIALAVVSLVLLNI